MKLAGVKPGRPTCCLMLRLSSSSTSCISPEKSWTRGDPSRPPSAPPPPPDSAPPDADRSTPPEAALADPEPTRGARPDPSASSISVSGPAGLNWERELALIGMAQAGLSPMAERRVIRRFMRPSRETSSWGVGVGMGGGEVGVERGRRQRGAASRREGARRRIRKHTRTRQSM